MYKIKIKENNNEDEIYFGITEYIREQINGINEKLKEF